MELEHRTTKIAIPRYAESVAPCFEYSTTMAIFSVKDGHVVGQIDVPIRSKIALDRLRLLKNHGVSTVICGGVEERYENMLRASSIRVVSWVSGDVEDLLECYLEGSLRSGSARLGGP